MSIWPRVRAITVGLEYEAQKMQPWKPFHFVIILLRMHWLIKRYMEELVGGGNVLYRIDNEKILFLAVSRKVK